MQEGFPGGLSMGLSKRAHQDFSAEEHSRRGLQEGFPDEFSMFTVGSSIYYVPVHFSSHNYTRMRRGCVCDFCFFSLCVLCSNRPHNTTSKKNKKTR